MADSKRYANHRKNLLPTSFVSEQTKWNGEKPHTQIETPLNFRPAVHPSPSFARFCETRISSKLLTVTEERAFFSMKNSSFKYIFHWLKNRQHQKFDKSCSVALPLRHLLFTIEMSKLAQGNSRSHCKR